MRVLHVIPDLRIGGAQRLCLDICRHLKRRGIETSLVTFGEINDFKSTYPDVEPIVINAHLTRRIFRKPFEDLLALNTFLEGYRPDIIHTHLFEAEYIITGKPLVGAKYFCHFHDNMVQFKRFSIGTMLSKRKLANLYEKYNLLRVYRKTKTHYVAVSRNGQQYIKDVLPKKMHGRINYLPNAVDLKSFISDSVKGDNKERRQLITVGSLIELKNHEFLVDVVYELKKRDFICRLKILGDGARKQYLQDYIRERGLQDQVELVGYVQDVQAHLQDADLYVHASKSESFGLVIVEAMAAGLPVVCLDAGGNRDIMGSSEAGILLSEANVELFADEVIRFLEPANYLKRSLAAVSESEKYGMDSYIDSLLKLYQ